MVLHYIGIRHPCINNVIEFFSSVNWPKSPRLFIKHLPQDTACFGDVCETSEEAAKINARIERRQIYRWPGLSVETKEKLEK